jgi:hypothetical protein
MKPCLWADLLDLIEKFRHVPYSLGNEAGVDVMRDFFDETIHNRED